MSDALLPCPVTQCSLDGSWAGRGDTTSTAPGSDAMAMTMTMLVLGLELVKILGTSHCPRPEKILCPFGFPKHPWPPPVPPRRGGYRPLGAAGRGGEVG